MTRFGDHLAPAASEPAASLRVLLRIASRASDMQEAVLDGRQPKVMQLEFQAVFRGYTVEGVKKPIYG
jgi:hypothetical protein